MPNVIPLVAACEQTTLTHARTRTHGHALSPSLICAQEWVLAEVARVLAPGGVVVVAFSDACWRERAAAGWLGRSGPQRLQLMEE